MRRENHNKSRFLGFCAGLIVKLFEKEQKKSPIKKSEFRISTQRMGIGFSEKIRDFWRNKWVFVKSDK